MYVSEQSMIAYCPHVTSRHVTSQDNKPSTDSKSKKAKEATSFTVGNPSRLIPSQLRFISLQSEGQRYVPICRQTAPSGIVMLLDLDPEAPESVERGSF